MKIFQKEFERERLHEENMLMALAEVPTLRDRISALAFPSSSPFLIMTRVGIHFAHTSDQYLLTRGSAQPQPQLSSSLLGPQFIRITPLVFGELIDVLRELHTASYVHRDVRIDNFFFCSETKKVCMHVLLCLSSVNQCSKFAFLFFCFSVDRSDTF